MKLIATKTESPASLMAKLRGANNNLWHAIATYNFETDEIEGDTQPEPQHSGGGASGGSSSSSTSESELGEDHKDNGPDWNEL